jgi:hypothetical protein
MNTTYLEVASAFVVIFVKVLVAGGLKPRKSQDVQVEDVGILRISCQCISGKTECGLSPWWWWDPLNWGGRRNGWSHY